MELERTQLTLSSGLSEDIDMNRIFVKTESGSGTKILIQPINPYDPRFSKI